MPKNRRILRVLLLLLTLLALLLAACDGDDEGDDDSNDTPTPAAVTTTAVEPTEEAVVEMAETEEAVVEMAETEEAVVEMVETAEVEVAMAETEEAVVEMAETEEAVVEMAETEEAVVEMVETEEAVVEMAETEEAVVEMVETEEVALTVVDVMQANSDVLSIVLTALGAADLSETLSDDASTYTVFAPVDAAFGDLEEGALEAVMADEEMLNNVLLSHVVEGTYLAADLEDGQELVALSGETLSVRVEADAVFINDAQVVTADLTASNGVVHTIDAVLLPAAEVEMEATEEAMLETVATEAAEIAMAATEEAVVEMAETEEAAVVEMTETEEAVVEMAATEEAVVEMEATAEAMPETEVSEDAAPTLVDVATANEVVLSMVLDLLAQANLADLLQGDEEYTVFAPINSAFNALTEEELEALQEDEAALEAVLQLHIVEGTLLAADLEDGMELETISGETLTVTIIQTTETTQDIYINNARVVFPDISADNGVLHMISRVIEVGGSPEDDPATAGAAEAEAEATEAPDAEPAMEATEEAD